MSLPRLLLSYPKIATFVLSTVPYKLIQILSTQKTIKAVNKSLNDVNYKEYLKRNNIQVKRIKKINDLQYLPISSKSDYINNIDVASSHEVQAIYRSSGYSGKSSYWYQTQDEIRDFFKYVEFNLRSIFGIDKKKTLIVMGFALSSWVTGQQVLAALYQIASKFRSVSIFNAGMNSTEIFDIVKSEGSKYEQILIFSYPLTFKSFLDESELKKLDLKVFNIKVILGAEGITYSWYKNFQEKLLIHPKDEEIRVFSAYGAADTGIGIASEQVSTIIIKELLFNSPQLRSDITGELEQPMHIFQYNPLEIFIEEINGEMIVTRFRSIPLVRYNIQDRIKLIDFNSMVKICNNHNIDLKELTTKKGSKLLKFPFLAIYGRSDATIILNGANIYVTSFKEALSDPQLFELHTGKFKVEKIEDNVNTHNFKVIVELKAKIKPTQELKDLFREKIIGFLYENDPGYRAAFHEYYYNDNTCVVEFSEFNNKDLKHKFY